MRVQIESILSERSGSCIASGRDDTGVLNRLIFYSERLPIEGEFWEVDGEIKNHEVHGPQMRVRFAEWIRPGGDMIIRFIERNPAFRGIDIGVARATKLWRHFGDSLYEVLDKGDAKALEKAKVIPDVCIDPLLSAWSSVISKGLVVRWLSQNEFPVGLAMQVIEFFGDDAINKLNSNPYKLLSLAGWKKCERVAEKLGVARDDARRLSAAAKEALLSRLKQGSTMMQRSVLEFSVTRYLGADQEALAKRAVDTAITLNEIVENDGWCSLTGIRMMEIDVAQLFKAFLGNGNNKELVQEELIPIAGSQDVERVIADCERELGYPLNTEQKSAISLAMTNMFSLLTGGAGTGKTTVLRALAGHYGPSTHMMALSGQAARRMTQATGREATTIEKFIRSHSRKRDNSSKFIIVDEASMLDLPLTARLLRSLSPDSRLLLVGDPEQLPPVNFGLIFHKLVDGGKAPRSHLTVVNRQKAASGIPAVSAAIREGELPEFGVTSEGGVEFIETSPEQIMSVLKKIKAVEPDTQILAPRNGSEDETSMGVGVHEINRAFHALYARGKPSLREGRFALGDPVVYKRNDAEMDLVNGSIGQVIDISEDRYSVEIDFEGNKQWISPTNLRYLQLAYALTVHKAQGSQFEKVAVVIERTQLLDRTWIYTAVTRGIKKVTLIGNRSAFDEAVKLSSKARNRHVFFDL